MTFDIFLYLLAALVVVVAIWEVVAIGIRHFARPTDLDIARSKRRRQRADIRRAVERSARGKR